MRNVQGSKSIGSGSEETNRAKGSHHLHRFASSDGQNRIRRTRPHPRVCPAGKEMDSKDEREGQKGPY